MVTRRDQREARARLILGIVLSDVCGEEHAAELYKQALRHDPESVAAHVRLSISYAYAEDYTAMIAAFSEAISLDPQATRTAACGRPEEVSQIGIILFPPEPATAARVYESVIPAEFKAAGELVVQAVGHLSEGRDGEAARALERSLRIDETDWFAVALLSLAYLLLRKYTGAVSVKVDGSALRTIDGFPVELIFDR
jgi:tetratricopeptide (TPR) repeat protein